MLAGKYHLSAYGITPESLHRAMGEQTAQYRWASVRPLPLHLRPPRIKGSTLCRICHEKRMRPPLKVTACLQGVTSLLSGHIGIQASHLSHRLSGQLDVIRTMDDPIHQRIRHSFVVKGVMPDVHR